MSKRGRITAGGMLRENTPVDDYREEYGLWVKREDLACPPPGPPFSKTRGVYARVKSRPEEIIGALDTRHSQAGHAVARACQILGKRCITYYPVFKAEPEPKVSQERAQALGAELVGLPAGRSAILFHQARKHCEALGGYMMPNALKLEESVAETAKEVANCPIVETVLVPISSGTMAAGVIRGLRQLKRMPRIILHLGYTRSHEEVERYVVTKGGSVKELILIDEGYQYKDRSRYDLADPPWPCNEFYDLKALHWWLEIGRQKYGEALFWNIG